MKPYALLLSPPIKDYLWGGDRLIREFGFAEGQRLAAEAWMLSCHKDGASVVENGALAGLSLRDAIDRMGKEVLGRNAAAYADFPLLVKLIDARDSLSVQVHPDDDYAKRVEGEFGKTEMWYVVDCEPGAKLVYGFERDVTKEQFRQAIENNTLMELCNAVPVQKGDVFFIEAGTLHAIGAGILIAEVQQNSNSTYRVYDFGRVGPDGKPRELHIDKAVDVTVTCPPTRPYGQVGEETPIAGGSIRELASCPLFTASLLTVDCTSMNALQVGKDDSFVSLVCLDGEGVLVCGGETWTMSKGSSIFIPAGLTAKLRGSMQLLESWV